MQSQNNRKEKILELIHSPFGIMLGIFLSTVLIVVTFMIYQNSQPKNTFIPTSQTEIDPASGETIYTDNSEPEEHKAVAYIGFAEILDSGLTQPQYEHFKIIVETYAKNRLSAPLSRVSFKKGSLNNRTKANVFLFTIVLNIDQETLNVTFDASRSPATTDYVTGSLNRGGQQVWRF